MIAAAKGFAVRFVIVSQGRYEKWYCSKTKKPGLSRGIYNNAGQLLFTPISYRLIIITIYSSIFQLWHKHA